MFEEIDTLLNLVLLMLISCGVVYCWQLNKRLKQLNINEERLNSITKHLEEVAAEAKQSTIKLNETIKTADRYIAEIEATTRAGHQMLEKLQQSIKTDRPNPSQLVSDTSPVDFSTELSYQQELDSYRSINVADKHVLEPPFYSSYYDTLKTIKSKRD